MNYEFDLSDEHMATVPVVGAFTSGPVSECDAPDGGAYYANFSDGELKLVCRCLVCSRCGHHTGNNTQGHYWRFCQHVPVSKRTKHVPFHFCCPDSCELESKS